MILKTSNKVYISDLTKSNTLIDHLNKMDSNTNVLLIFDHGLGDFILFLPIFDKIISLYPNLNIKLGCHENLGVESLHSDIITLKSKIEYNDVNVLFASPHVKYNLGHVHSKYQYIFNIKFTECKSKPKMCLYNEIGLRSSDYLTNYNLNSRFNLTPVNINDTNRVGIHVTSNTAVKRKSLDMVEIKVLWDSLEDEGYFPFLFFNKFKCMNKDCYTYDFSWIPEEHKINENLNLKDIYTEISKCKYFLGVTSGLICSARVILGDNRCGHLKKWGRSLKYFIEQCDMIENDKFNKNSCKNFLNEINKKNTK